MAYERVLQNGGLNGNICCGVNEGVNWRNVRFVVDTNGCYTQVQK